MKRSFFVVVCCMCLQLCADAPATRAFGDVRYDKSMISLSLFQNLDMRAAFETLYEMADLLGSVDELPEGFVRCWQAIKSGNDRVATVDFLESIRLIAETVLVLRNPAE